MKDPLPVKGGFQAKATGFGFGYQNKNTTNSANTGGSNGKKCKPEYCWNFNKGLVCKYGKKYRFIERCSYCDSDSHGIVKCNKLEKDKKPNDEK